MKPTLTISMISKWSVQMYKMSNVLGLTTVGTMVPH